MTPERFVRGVAGGIITLSAALAAFHNPLWLLLTAFVGVSLFQSAFTDACPGLFIARKLFGKDGAAPE